MDAAISHQVILFQATVQSYVIEYTGQQQKLPTKDNAAQPTLDNVLEKGILIDENLWFDWLQDDVFTEAPKVKKQQDQGGGGKADEEEEGQEANETQVYIIQYEIAS